MKQLLKNIALPLLGIIFLASCKKDETQIQTSGGTAFTLSASSATFVLTLATQNDPGGSFTWGASNYGYSAVVNYKLQYDKKGNNFASFKEMDLGNNLTTKTLKQNELNGIGLQCGIAAGGTGDVDFRIKASIGLDALPVYSTTTSVKITTYDLVVFWYVPGAYQGWNPAAAPKLGATDYNSYEGYVNAAGGGNFKITSDPDWNHTNYGDGGGGTLSTSGGDIAWAAGSGYYQVKANKSALTYSLTKVTWSVIGDGASGWGTDIPMVYDAVNQVWKVTTTTSNAGKIKFRANNAWGINFGDDGGNGSLEYGGADISMPVSGSHTITLDLSKPLRYTYSIQ